jgi:hypothetical protein
MFCTNPDVNGAPATGVRAIWAVWYVESALAVATQKHAATEVTNTSDRKRTSLIVPPLFDALPGLRINLPGVLQSAGQNVTREVTSPGAVAML